MDTGEILIFAIGLNVTAGLGAIGFAWLDDGWGSRKVVLASLCGLIAVGLPILFLDDKMAFIAAALALGIFVGPTQAASRSLMARLSPPAMQTEMFGLYALTGKAAAVLGPALFAIATDMFDSQRAGMATILILFVVGGAILIGVREPPHPDRS
jgi:UMF1 family MFS transporter